MPWLSKLYNFQASNGSVSRQPLIYGAIGLMQEKELKEQLELYNEKSKIKSDLVGKLMDVSEGFQFHCQLNH